MYIYEKREKTEIQNVLRLSILSYSRVPNKGWGMFEKMKKIINGLGIQ